MMILKKMSGDAFLKQLLTHRRNLILTNFSECTIFKNRFHQNSILSIYMLSLNRLNTFFIHFSISNWLFHSRYYNYFHFMSKVRVQDQNFLSFLLANSTKLWKYGDHEAHYQLQTKNRSLYFSCRRFSDIRDMDDSQTKRTIEQQTNQFIQQYSQSQSKVSPFILAYEQLIISYPYAIFTHHPIENNLIYFIERNLEFSKKITLMIRIGEAVESLHSQNLSINTLRPSIVLVWQNNNDFEVLLAETMLRSVKKDEEEQKEKQKKDLLIRPNPYTAPELHKKYSSSLSSDIWSLGLIYYEIISGQRISSNIFMEKTQLTYNKEIEKWMPNFIDRLVNEDEKSRHKIGDILKILKNARLCCN